MTANGRLPSNGNKKRCASAASIMIPIGIWSGWIGMVCDVLSVLWTYQLILLMMVMGAAAKEAWLVVRSSLQEPVVSIQTERNFLGVRASYVCSNMLDPHRVWISGGGGRCRCQTCVFATGSIIGKIHIMGSFPMNGERLFSGFGLASLCRRPNPSLILNVQLLLLIVPSGM